MQKITPHLWFDKEAKEAAEFYVSAFGGGSEVTDITLIKDTPSGDTEIVTFTLLGHDFMAISAGPVFRINPSVSFFVNFDPSRRPDAREALDDLWAKLAEGGTPLMPLDEYPFSQHYGWIQDRYGVSWQLILSNPEGDPRPDITPSLMFTKDAYGKAEEAMNFYISVFEDSQEGIIARYGPGREPDREGAVMYEDFRLFGQWFAAMDSAGRHDFTFNEAVSLIVHCGSQEEVDYFWEKLPEGGGSEGVCGWLKDRYGLSWQVIPTAMGEFLGGPDAEGRQRATQAMLKMKKLDIAALGRAYKGEE
jgi:predicted 3-demethylubiquinone-9 3-methyltransferase (glyoxalase superfamily)